ncbi:molecular chaperone DnaK (HSP70) [Catenuloplanes niger]|uniref:Molecular chaperone DnaK (HSP70) n=1 Tax=Catenuloplanes niger TaxID=587534 RepID=A0AAE4A0N2_9ACTN|nr:molecular chaperone DnaK (HSP70) [Catenuloplanes niger]
MKVGEEAKDAAKTDPERVVSLIKRHMGSDTELEFDGVTYTPESVSAFIIRDLARQAGGESVRDVVITVPAYFGVSERRATQLAGEIAKLNVVSLVPEPVAAALYYGALHEGEDRTILVYDLGGGTFDTTVIRLEGGDVTVVCTDGDHQLGGADWDARIVDHLSECFMSEYPDSGAGDSEEFLQQLGLQAEALKKSLSTRISVRAPIRFDGRTLPADLTRETFEEITADLLARTIDITRRTLATADRTPDAVLLVGGSTHMPAVTRALRSAFGFTPQLHDPHLAVAKGAAMFALQETIRVRLPETDEQGTDDPGAIRKVAADLGVAPTAVRAWQGRKVTIVVPRAFGVGVVARDTDPKDHKLEVSHVLMPNTPLPSDRVTRQYQTAVTNQTSILVPIYEQAGTEVSHLLDANRKIGEGTISRLPPLPKGSPIDITFSMTEGGLLTVTAVELVTGQEVHIEVQIGGLDDKRVREATEAVDRLS